MGGQRTLRAYWRNYYEATDALVWVVDAADTARLADAAAELRALLAEEKARRWRCTRRGRRGCTPAKRAALTHPFIVRARRSLAIPQLAGASVLVLANKQDIAGAASLEALHGALGLGELAARGRHAKVVACSAVSGDGLLGAFEWLVADVAARIFLLD